MLGPFLEGGRGLPHINVVKCALCARLDVPRGGEKIAATETSTVWVV